MPSTATVHKNMGVAVAMYFPLPTNYLHFPLKNPDTAGFFIYTMAFAFRHYTVAPAQNLSKYFLHRAHQAVLHWHLYAPDTYRL